MDVLYSTCTVTRESGISTRQLYYWEQIGLIQPKYETFGMRKFRRYTAGDLERLKSAKHLLDRGFTLQAVKHNLLSGMLRDERLGGGGLEGVGPVAGETGGVEVIHL